MRPVHYLEFDDPTGTERDRFATFRLHHAWAKRLRKGRLVFLADTKERLIYGKAKVLFLQTGKAWELLRLWAEWSHLELVPATALPDYVPPKDEHEAQRRRFEHMLRRYGPHRIEHASNMTMIFLQRVK